MPTNSGRMDDYSGQGIQQNVQVHDTPLATANPADFGGQGLANLGQGLNTLTQADAQTQIEANERAAAAWSAQAVGKAHADMYGEMLNQKNSAQPGAPGFTQNFAKSFDDYTSQVVQNAPTLAAQDYATRTLGSLRARMVDQAQYFQENEQNQYQLGQFSDGIKSATNAAVMDPSQTQTLMATLKAPIDAAVVEPAVKRELYKQLQEMPYYVMEAQADSNPAQTKALMGQSLNIEPQTGAMQNNAGPGEPLGLRNNNPGNLKADGTPWQGLSGNDGTFAQFQTPEAGVRAATLNVQHQIDVHGNNTIGSLFGALAPASDNNDPQAYAASVSKMTGIPADQTLNSRDPDQMNAIMSAYFKMENSGKMPSDAAMQTGVAAGMGTAALPKFQAAPNPDGTPASNDVTTGNFNVDALPVPQRLALYARANAQLDKQKAQLAQQTDQKMRDDVSMAMNGQPVSAPISPQVFSAAFGDVEGPVRAKVYQNSLQTGQIVSNMKTQTPDQIMSGIQALKPEPGAGFAAEQENYQRAQEAGQHVIAAQLADPQGYAQANGLGPAEPLNVQDTNAFRGQLQGQLATARTMRDQYGTGFAPLSKPQANWLGATLNSADPNTAVGILHAIATSSQNPDDTTAILGQLKGSTPVLAKAGELMAHGDQNDVAAALVQGNQIVKAKGGMDTYVGKPEQFGQAFDNEMGSAYAGQPQTRSQDLAAVTAYYAYQQSMGGKTAGVGVDTGLLQKSINAVVGQPASFNGSPVIAPHGVTPDTFSQQIQNAWPAILKAQGVDPDNVPSSSAHLMRMGDGEYAVMLGNGPLKGANGQPVTMNWSGYTHFAPGLKNNPRQAAVMPSPETMDQPQNDNQTSAPQ